MSLDARLQEMLDHHEITKLLAVYCHGSDRMDESKMAGVYLEDSWDDHGLNKCPGPEFARRSMSNLGKGSEMCSHQLGQSQIKVTGDVAGAETYFIATLRRRMPDGENLLLQMGGRYVDTLHRVDEGWKIKHRTCVRDWSITHRIEADWLENNPFVEGQRSGADPSFAVLGLKHLGPGAPVRFETA
jgi:hypothetical protein